MRRLLDWLLGRARRRPVLSQVHPALGTLRYDPEACAWRTVVETPVGPLGFLIGGSDVPDAMLLAHGAAIAADAPKFLALVRNFLEEQARAVPVAAREIRALQLEEVCLRAPRLKGDGMLYFAQSADSIGVWRCDYVAGQPRSLGCDT